MVSDAKRDNRFSTLANRGPRTVCNISGLIAPAAIVVAACCSCGIRKEKSAMESNAVRIADFDQLAVNVQNEVQIEGIAWSGKGRSDLNATLGDRKVSFRLVPPDGGPWLWPNAAEGEAVIVTGTLKVEAEQVRPVQGSSGLQGAEQSDLRPGEPRPASYCIENCTCAIKATGERILSVDESRGLQEDPFSQ